YASSDDAFLAEDQAFIEALQTGERSGILSDYADAFRTQAVTCAANESMASGEPVTIEEP
ncbi:MAG: gfo/Idh/MocA family oxidoreductase, partial [Candidatus Brocadiia bacterium]